MPAAVAGAPLGQAPVDHLPTLCRLLHRLCAPLEHIHRHGVVHCDLKPSNVFILPGDRVVLIDFGLVARSSKLRETLEVSGEAVGTASFMAPEQIRGDDIDGRADLYSLGCILYECLVGRPPFSANSEIKLFDLHLHAPPIPPSQWVQGVPAKLEELVLQLLAKHARDRPASAEHVGLLFAEYAGITPTVAELVSSSDSGSLYRPELAGRSALIDQLESELLDLRRYSVLLLGAESGMGKTRLCSELGRRTRGHEYGVITGECILGGAPLHPLLPLLQAIGDYCRNSGRQTALRFTKKHGKLLSGFEPSWRALAGVDEQSAPPPLPAEEARRRLYDALREVLQSYLQDRPTLLILDDVQWADELSREFLRRHGAALFHSCNAPLVLAYRLEEAAAVQSLQQLEHARRIELPPLDEEAVGAIVCDMLGLPQRWLKEVTADQSAPSRSRPPDATSALHSLVRFLTKQSEGSPFFVGEYLRLAAAEGVLERDAKGRFRLHGDLELVDFRPSELGLPATLRELVGRRLDGLPPRLAAVVEFAAVLGREGSGTMLAQACKMTAEESEGRIAELVARQVFEDREAAEVRFVHDKLWEVAYERIAAAKRPTLHRAAATLIEQTKKDNLGPSVRALARHHDLAGNVAAAVDYYEQAADQAAAEFSNHEAIGYYERALVLASTGGQVAPVRRAKWESALCNAYLCIGNMAEAYRHGEQTVRATGRRLPKNKIALVLGLFALILRVCLQHLFPRLLRERDPQRQALFVEAAGVSHHLSESFIYENDIGNAIYAAVLGLRLALALPPSPPLGRSLSIVGILAASIPLHFVSRPYKQRAREVIALFDDADLSAYCLSRTGVYSINVADWSDVDQALERSLALSREVGNGRTLCEAILIQSISRYYRGDLKRALDGFAAGRNMALELNDPQMAQVARTAMAQSQLRLGRLEESLATVSEIAGLQDTASGRFWSQGVTAQVLYQAGRREEALQVADQAFAEMCRNQPLVYWVFPGIVGTCETYRAELVRAEDPSTRKRLERAVVGLKKFARPMRFAAPSLALYRGYLELHHHPRRAARHFHHALDLAQTRGTLYEEGRAHAELAKLDLQERTTHLNAAESIFVRIGALTDLGQVRSQRKESL